MQTLKTSEEKKNNVQMGEKNIGANKSQLSVNNNILSKEFFLRLKLRIEVNLT